MNQANSISEDDVWQALRDVPDPEIPTVNVVDLGVIDSVVLRAGLARVGLLPTFNGCPAIELMREQIRARVERLGLRAQVDVVRDVRWGTERISAAGRDALARAGIAPPAPAGSTLIPLLEPARCPHCGSRHTTLENAFGPTLCRAIAYCRDCRQPFEQFKPL